MKTSIAHVFLLFVLLGLSFNSYASSMLCDPRPGSDFPVEIFKPEFFLTSPTPSTRQLSFNYQSKNYDVELTALNDTEFMGAFESYTLFFAKEDAYFVKMNLFVTDLTTMESLPIIRLNCYLLEGRSL